MQSVVLSFRSCLKYIPCSMKILRVLIFANFADRPRSAKISSRKIKRRKNRLQPFRERLSGKVHTTILNGIAGGFEFSVFQRNLKELARKAMEMCLRVLKESNKSRFDSYSRQEQFNSVLIISHITFRDCRVHIFSDNLSRNRLVLCKNLMALLVCT